VELQHGKLAKAISNSTKANTRPIPVIESRTVRRESTKTCLLQPSNANAEPRRRPSPSSSALPPLLLLPRPTPLPARSGGARARARRSSRPRSAEPAAGGARAHAGVVAGDARPGAGRARPRRPKICVVSVEDAYLRFRSGGRQNRFANWVFCWIVYLATQTTV